jgi:tetratricopeptide (TPR) repeat protein
VKKFLTVVTFCSLLALGASAFGQTFEIPGQSQDNSPSRKKSAQRGGAGSANEIGWGSSIEVGRLARAAEDALKRGNAAEAANYAERAVKAAPQNAKLWFLLGYTSRLAGRETQSVQAYQRGLQAEPSSLEGLSGLAQTYARMGQTDEAKRLLLQVIAANPRRANDLLVAGELFLQTGDTAQGLQLLQRADAMQPSAHAELMMAMAYLRLKQPDRAKQLLDRAKQRAPRDTDIFRAVANYYRETHDYEGAIETLKSAPKMTVPVLADLAYTYALAGKKKESAETYARAAELEPKQIGLQLSAAQAQANIGDLDRARTFLARAASLDENNYRLHAIRAGIARLENRTGEAIKEYNVALEHLPAEGVPEGPLYPVQLRLNLSELYQGAGDAAAAKEQIQLAEAALSKMQVEGPAKAEFLRVRASLETADGNFAAAENDLKQALQLDPANTIIALQYANLLWKTGRKDQAKKAYADVLNKDATNRLALEGLGYLAREEGDNKTAEEYFLRLAAAYPNDYVPYLAMGDMFTALRDFAKADADYQKAYALAPSNPVTIAGGANAAIEAHDFKLAGNWLARAQGTMQDDPRVMRERERYLFHQGKYLESAQLGYKVLQALPRDREGSVYLAYDLYNLGRYDDVLAVVSPFERKLPNEPNFPLLAGHVHKQFQLLYEAAEDYTRALQRDPQMVEAYINRGYVLNDMQNAEEAAQDFHQALKLSPNNGVAHLGLAFSELQLHHGKTALDEVDIAEKLLGESGATHLARATAFRQQRLLLKAEKEYRAALKFAPRDLKLQLALADTQYHLRQYQESIGTLNEALALSPGDPFIFAEMAHAHAQLRHRTETLRYVQAAEKEGGDESAVLLATGDALLILGDRDAAMQRFERALDAPDADRVSARLDIARLFVRDGRWDDAREQVSLAFAESRIGEASPVTADNMVEAANLFLAMHDFDMAERLFERAGKAGAADEVVAIGLANTYLAKGDSTAAETELARLGSPADLNQNYDYMLAMGTLYRQRHQDLRALTAFARANQLAGEDDVAERQLEEVAGQEGLRLNQRFSYQSDLSVAPLFDDATIYMTDAGIFGVKNKPALLPGPRSSLQTLWTNGFRARQSGLPLISGFFQVRNARGTISLPSEAAIINRDTWDYSTNGALNPVLRLGGNSVAFNTGLQFTWRRDKESPLAMNQNLFRQFVYMSSSAFGNWVAVRGSLFHEAGPFTNQRLNSRDIGGHIEFTVGHPWGRTALVTGYAVRDLQFHPLVREFFTTSSWIGWQRKFGDKLTLTGMAEYLRSWRVQDLSFALGQALRPAAQVAYRPAKNWSVDGAFAFSRGMGFHAYDNVQSGLLISYVKPLHRLLADGSGEVQVAYPLRFSVGIEQQDFFNFTGRGQAIFRPVFRLTLF